MHRKNVITRKQRCQSIRILPKSAILAVVLLSFFPAAFCQPAQFRTDSIALPDDKSTTRLDAQVSESTQAFGLPDLEKIAAENNPTILQASAAVSAAQGRAKQAGLPPNPVIGFEGMEWAFRAWDQKAEYFGFFEQTVPLGGKLKKARRIYEQEAKQAEIGSSAQRVGIENTVKMAFYEALGTQQQVDINTQLVAIAEQAATTTSELFNVGQADKPDFLQAQIELEEVKHDLLVASNNWKRSLKELSAVVGKALPANARLIGTLEDRFPAINEEQTLSKLLTQSPQIRAAQVQINRAKAVVARAKAEPYPDMFVRSGFGVSREFLDSGNSNAPPKRTGAEMNLQVGLSVPLWNRNQGGIATAKADLAFAQSEYDRLKLGLTMRFAQVSTEYANTLDSVQRYSKFILPNAKEAYQLYLTKYKTMSASYPQVIISQRTLFQAQRQYVRSVVNLLQTGTQLEGFLLSGGLNAPQMRPESPAANQFELNGAPSAIRTGHDTGADTAGIVMP